jgi:CRISPR-associated endoribonuclease Cas6
LQLYNTEWQVEEVEFSSSDMWTGISTWADLMNKTLGHHIRFTFATPVIVIVKGDNDSNDGYPLSFPSPINVFADLKRRWEVLDGPELPGGWEDFLNAGSCYVSDYHNLRGTMTQTPQGSQIMYSGTVAYEYRKNEPKYNNALNALAQLAFYTGVGRETVRGMGATRIIILE